jgi:O-antigen ligase
MCSIMKISKEKYKKSINFFLTLIAITLIFRKPCTWLIIMYSLFSLFYVKKITFTKEGLKLFSFIAFPLIVEIMFFWNNNSYILGLKAIEKSAVLLIFPFFIIGNYKRINFYKIVNFYRILVPIIVLIFYISYINFDDTYVNIYSKREDYLWAIGYSFSNYVGMHGPALNMHLSFVSICNFYFIFYKFKTQSMNFKIINIICFLISFYLVVFVNSKLALAILILNIVLIFFIELKSLFSLRKLILVFVLLISTLSTIIVIYIKNNPYMITKYTEVTFAHMDKIGRLDEVENPTANVFNSFVTRVSIWKSTLELISDNFLLGVGASDSKKELVEYFKKTDQKFLAQYEFPVHNQFLDSSLKYGILGFISISIYFFSIFYLWRKTKKIIILCFFILFLSSNLTDDFMIRFDGIVFSSFWICVFTTERLKKKE